MRTRGEGRTLRTILLGGALAVLTLAGHTAAGGGIDPVGIGIALLVSAALACALAQRRRSVPALVGILLGGQVLLHVVLTVSSAHPGHGGASVSGSAMALGHAGAALIAALLIAHADAIAAAWRDLAASVLGSPLRAPTAMRVPSPMPAVADEPRSTTLLLLHHLVRRGPPGLVAPA